MASKEFQKTIKESEMGLRHCFVDEHGNVWRSDTLIKAAEAIPAEPFPVQDELLEEVLRWKIRNVRDFIVHYKRVQVADCSIPIILRSDGYPMDGRHRIIKAMMEGLELSAKRFKVDPKPDFESVV